MLTLSDYTPVTAQVNEMMQEPCQRTKMKADEFKFKPARTWLGGQATERIEGWQTRIYEASGRMNAMTTHKARTVCIEQTCSVIEHQTSG